MGRVGERLRQNLFFTSGFDATSNQRNTSTLKELEVHEKALKRTIKHVKDFHKATLALLGESEASYQMHLPRAYELDTTKSVLPADSEDVLYTKNSVPAVPQERADPALSTRQTGIARITDVKGQLEDRLRNEVYFPTDKWLADLTAAKKSMAALEQLRLELDHTRRTLANVELKKVKQERNKGHASDQVLAKASTKSTMLESAKARFREKEQQVYEELHDLVERADVHRDALAATYNVTRDIMALAEAAAAPAMQRQSTSDKQSMCYPGSSVAGDTPYAHSKAPLSSESYHGYQAAAPPATPASVAVPRSPPGTAQTMVISHNGEGYAPVYASGAPASPASDEEAAEHYYVPSVRRSQLPSY